MSDDRELFDLVWAYPIGVERRGRHVMTRRSKVTIDRWRGFDAVIVYPALLTPEVVAAGDARVELLIAVRPKERFVFDAWDVHLQLKVCRGIDPNKRIEGRPLVPWERGEGKDDKVREVKSKIAVRSLGALRADHRVSTHDRLSCMLDRRAVQTITGAGYTELYAVSFERGCLPSGEARDDSALNVRCDQLGRLLLGDPHDLLVERTLERLLKDGQAQRVYSASPWTYTVKDEDLIVGDLDKRRPIQAYHPVVVYPSKTALNIGHLADLHISSRQQALARSSARVIEHDGAKDISPPIGAKVNVSSENVKSLLDQLGRDEDVDVILIGGDVIDHLRNWYPNKLKKDTSKGQVEAIWDEVSLTGDDYELRYQDYVDLISFYSLVLYAYEHYRKPIFVVSGNHDCYMENYGMYPTLPFPEWLVDAPNPGIPMDHNLTIYEAILAFGPSYGGSRPIHGANAPATVGSILDVAGVVNVVGAVAERTGVADATRLINEIPVIGDITSIPTITLGIAEQPYIGLFEASYFTWFYTALTPISDFAQHLPGQSIVGLSWGETEHMIDPAQKLYPCTHGFGHLPRADKAVSDDQLAILRTAIERKKERDPTRSITLMTHFTFVSYKEDEPFLDGRGLKEGVVYLSGALLEGDKHSPYDWGTFQLNREAVYKHVMCGDIDLVVTGHSHRRGAYTLVREEASLLGGSSVRVRPTGVFRSNEPLNAQAPLVVVSDSAGPIPRRNEADELGGFGLGSDRPSATKIVFGNRDKRDLSLTVVPSTSDRCKPRLAVALDYLDHKRPVLPSIEAHAPRSGETLTFKAVIDEAVIRCAAIVEARMYVSRGSGEPSREIRFRCDNEAGPVQRLSLDASNLSELKRWLPSQEGDKIFFALRFEVNESDAALREYDAMDYWIFECHVAREEGKEMNRYTISRDRDAEKIPDLEWRRRFYPDKYRRPQKG